ncbi:hypothetical protein E2K93_12530 [Thalassotalea sp. HSM 43]|uniref:AhpA/YtjB family protein n=1 Tax=Thalassotalea sp. HSM 43 TaxID=2552945 RepID=UPI001080E30C|nr:AhpA/YtjB family protein [Thalassotalea sp. HSM 43]QBY05157.1 hypothetical protein E2K93_12530 [Thalassotalea sp. HSM 43]
MDDPNEIIYPQVTPIYVKLMQIGVAVILLLMILNLSVMGVDDSEDLLDKHFDAVAKQHLLQAVNTSKVLLADKNKQQIQAFVSSLADADFVEQAVLYDSKGEAIASSDNQTSIQQLYGLSLGSESQAADYVPFIEEIREQKLYGYLRMNLVKQNVTEQMQGQIYSQFELFRIMLITAVVAGFLLTRGLSRFSRHGLRLPIKSRQRNSP